MNRALSLARAEFTRAIWWTLAILFTVIGWFAAAPLDRVIAGFAP